VDIRWFLPCPPAPINAFGALTGQGWRTIFQAMILKIARMGHPILAGLAAPQVHVPLRLVVFQAPGERADPGLSEDERFDHTAPLTVLINPEIAILSPETEGGWEG